MKKIIFAIIAAITVSTSVLAQTEDGKKPERKPMDKTEMVKRQTEHMAKEYGLNETQAAQLLEVNTAYADKMPRMGRPRNGGGRGQMRGQQRPDGTTGATAQSENRERPSREQMEARMKEMKANKEAYDAELKKIMTDEQFAKYQENSKKRFEGGNRGPRGPRGGNRNRSNQ